MPRNSVPRYTLLAIERILKMYSDDGHRLTVMEIRNHLHDLYGIDVSDDHIRRDLLPALEDFYNRVELEAVDRLEEQKLARARLRTDGQAGCEVDRRLDAALTYPERTRLAFEPARRQGSRAYVSIASRTFADHEVDFLIDSVASTTFMEKNYADDLILRILSLQSPTSRTRNLMAAKGTSMGIKPAPDEFTETLSILREAITRKQTVQFFYARYSALPAAPDDDEYTVTLEAVHSGRAAGDFFYGTSVYRLQYMNGHYFALMKDPGREGFRNRRVDLIQDIRIDTGEVQNGARARYAQLADEHAPEAYFATAVDGFGGESETVRIHCTGGSLHYVAERFLGYPGFAVRRPSDERRADWYEVSFECNPLGFANWALKFPNEIEILEPAATRAYAISKLKNNAYGLELVE